MNTAIAPVVDAQAGARVRVLSDPGDDVAVTAGLLARHDPAAGRVVVHPTPATQAPAALGHDVLSALGLAVNRLGPDQLVSARRAWRAAAAWTAADRIADLVVLRADRLSASGWSEVLALSRATGARLTLVCHTPTIPTELAVVLDGVDHQLLTDLTQLDLPAPDNVAGLRPNDGQTRGSDGALPR